jgi:L-ascorbate metabolism protein UlaG (beta-lactamase superfamily)
MYDAADGTGAGSRPGVAVMCLACLRDGTTTIRRSVTRRRLLRGLASGVVAAASSDPHADVVTARNPRVQPTDDAFEDGASATPAPTIDAYRRHELPDGGPLSGRGLAVTFLGTTSFLFDDGDTQLLIDGFLTRPSVEAILGGPIATDRSAVDRALARAGVRSPAAVFVAHSHWDHALDVAHLARQTGATLHGSPSTLNVGRGGGLAGGDLVPFDPGARRRFGRFAVTVLPSKHSPPTGINDDIGMKIDRPLAQPTPFSSYVEGGSFDFLIEHDDRAILVKPSANYLPGALDGLRAEVVFLGTATLGHQDAAFRDAFYRESVGAVRPDLVVPVHWDNFFLPLAERLELLNTDDIPAGFDFLIDRLGADGIGFGLMRGFQRVTLFAD